MRRIIFFRKEKSAEPGSPAPEEGKEKGAYATLPKSLKAEVLVRAKVEDPIKQRDHAEIVKAKSVHELSQINSLGDFPMPERISRLVHRAPRPVERKKKFREK